jgi:L-aminopeptidase/D-esterase-like protein
MTLSGLVSTLCALTLILGTPAVAGQRARDLGVPFDGEPGLNNAITDVAGVTVGQTTLIRGQGSLKRGKGPVRTGVTVVFPLGASGRDAVAAGFATINGTGEFTGVHMIDETGLFFGPIALTGTGDLSVVHQALIDWASQPGRLPESEVFTRLLPVVGETLDIRLNDVFGHPMTEADVFAALDGARGGMVDEGNVGGGTGMVAYGFKGGIGAASRVVKVGSKTYTVGVLLQANHGRRQDLRVAGVPVGQEIRDLRPTKGEPAPGNVPNDGPKNSLLIVIATDAPLQAHQLQRIARRAALGVGRDGSIGGDYSGEFALAFSTTNTLPFEGPPRTTEPINDNQMDVMDALFEATVQSVEEALINQLVASTTMTGVNGATVYSLPHDRLITLMKAYGRYRAP